MKVAIAGYGVEGRQNYLYWAARGHEVTIVDEKQVPDAPIPQGAARILGHDAFARLDEFDMVVRTAGLAPTRLHTTAKIWSATNEFLQQCPAPVIGVTGSKGKGTTCSFVVSILEAAGKTVHLVGNIGIPAIETLAQIQSDDIVVYELSSFQLWDAERSPHTAVVLHIEPDHLDVHADFTQYLAAKSNIVVSQTRNDTCFYHPTNEWSLAIARNQPDFATQAAKYNAKDNGNSHLETAYVQDGMFKTTAGRVVCSTDVVKLPGAHNLDNACAAISACLQYSVSDEAIEKGLSAFLGLEHRLKFVADKAGVRYYDDSIATTPGSAIAAVNSFVEPKVLILGGSYKGGDFTSLAHELEDVKLRAVVLIGDEAERIAATFTQEGFDNFVMSEAKTMNEIVSQATGLAQKGDVVILSPACASFDMFKSYKDRGEQFIGAVQAL